MMTIKEKIIFMGTPQFAADVLTGIIKEIPVHSVITRPDKPKGRNGEPVPSEVKIMAEKEKIRVFQPQSKQELSDYILKERPDLIIVAAFGMILPDIVLKTPLFGAINVHPSLLPKYRGPAPIEAAIFSGDKTTGVTIMEIATEVDAGNIIAQREVSLIGTETTPALEKTLAELSAAMLKDVIPIWISGTHKSIPQENEKATFTRMLEKDDGKINFLAETAEDIERKERAFIPWPGIYANWENKKIDFFDVEVSDKNLEPGKVERTEEGKIIIGTKRGSIIPKYIKLEGRNKVPAIDFVRGYPNFIGAKLV